MNGVSTRKVDRLVEQVNKAKKRLKQAKEARVEACA